MKFNRLMTSAIFSLALVAGSCSSGPKAKDMLAKKWQCTSWKLKEFIKQMDSLKKAAESADELTKTGMNQAIAQMQQKFGEIIDKTRFEFKADGTFSVSTLDNEQTTTVDGKWFTANNDKFIITISGSGNKKDTMQIVSLTNDKLVTGNPGDTVYVMTFKAVQ